MPPRRNYEVDRERLLDRISECATKPVTVVSAPPGAGKTYAVASWVRAGRTPGLAAWLTVDEADAAPGIFWAYAVESLRSAGVPLDEGVRTPARADAVGRSFLARLAASLAALDRPVVLVLDQIDQAAGPEVSAGLDFVLRNASPKLRLVITTRSDPVLPLHRYRLSGELADIGREELAFTFDEADALLNMCQPDQHDARRLSPAVVKTLLERTEGWVGGLRLYAIALQQVDDPERLIGEPRVGAEIVADYLRAEVLDTLPPQTRDLLQRASILHRIHPDLADRLTGRDDAASTLSELAKANAFVERIEDSGQWYRCHPMFGATLRSQLTVSQPRLEAELHRRAARWLAHAGHLSDSLEHAVAIEDWEFAAGQVVEQLAIGRLLGGLEQDRLGRLLARMPSNLGTAATALVAAARSVNSADLRHCLAWLDLAEQRTGGLPPSQQPSHRLGVALLRVIAGRVLGDAESVQVAAASAESVLRQVPAERLAGRPELSALILSNLGAAQLWAGCLSEAAGTLERAVTASTTPGTEYVRHASLGQLALLDLRRGRLRQARTNALESVRVTDRSGIPVSFNSGAARAALASIALEWNEPKAARGFLQEAFATAGGQQDPLVVAELAITRSRMERAKGDLGGALDSLRRAAQWTLERRDPRWLANRLLAETVRVHLPNRDIAAAEACLERMDPGPELALAQARVHLASARPNAALRSLGDLGSIAVAAAGEVCVQAQLVRAQAAFAMKDEMAARRAIAQAVELARPEGYRRPFLEIGVWVRQMISRFPDLVHAQRWLAGGSQPDPDREDRRAPRSGSQQYQPLVVESLSQREREVLQLLAQGYSAQEISAELFVSINTVKTHLKGIYRKLSASRRREAVGRARELNLI